MADDKNFGPLYLTADGRFTKERPKWMRPKGCDASDMSEFLPEKEKPKYPKYPKSKLSDEAARKIAEVLHVMLNNK